MILEFYCKNDCCVKTIILLHIHSILLVKVHVKVKIRKKLIMDSIVSQGLLVGTTSSMTNKCFGTSRVNNLIKIIIDRTHS